MFNTLKSLLLIIVAYNVFVLLGSPDAFSVFTAAIPYLYAISAVVIAASVGVLIYFSKFKHKDKLLLLFIVMSALFFSLPSYADNPCDVDDSDSRRGCSRCVTTAVGSSHGGFGCWPCSIFDSVFNIFDNIITATVGPLTSGLLALLTAGFCVWLAYSILVQFLVFKDQDIGRFMTKLGVMAFKVMIMAALLRMNASIFGYILNPIVGVISEYASAVLDKGLCTAGSGVGTSALSGALRSNLFCMIQNFFNELLGGINLGSVLMCVSLDVPSTSLTESFLRWLAKTVVNITIPYLSLLIFGAAIWVAHVLMLIFFPFFVFDTLFRFCFFAIGLPFVIAFWPFSFLGAVMKRLIKILIMAVLNLLLLSVMMRIITALFAEIMKGAGIKQLLQYCASWDFMSMRRLMDSGIAVDIFFAIFLVIIVTLAGFMMLKTIPKISAGLVNYGGLELGAAMATKNVADTAAKATADTGIAAVGNVTGVAGKGLNQLRNTGIGKKAAGGAKNFSAKLGEKAGELTDMGIKKSREGVNKVAAGARKGVNAAADGVQAGTDAAGKGIMSAGKGIAALPVPVVAQVVGAAVIVAGAAVSVAGKVANKAVKAGTYAAEKSVKAGTYVAEKGARAGVATAKMGAKASWKTAKYTTIRASQGAQSVAKKEMKDPDNYD